MTKVSYFQRYSQRENVVTNNVLHLLGRIYDHRPSKLERVLSLLIQDLADGGPDLEVGPRFVQQVRGPERVADGLISQPGFDVLIETKLGAKFSEVQAIGHLKHVKQSANPVVILLGNAPHFDDKELTAFLEAARALPRVRVAVCTFKDVIDACRVVVASHEDQLSDVIDDFEDFCLDLNLMSMDECTMFVPPCGQSFHDNVKWKLYYTPATRPRRSGSWLGVYRDKRVHFIGRIDLVLDVGCEMTGEVLTPTANDEQRKRILGAIEDAKVRNWDLLEAPHTFYLCSDMTPTAFDKDSPGGIPGHRYFDLTGLRQDKDEVLTASKIAGRLNGRKWSEWGVA